MALLSFFHRKPKKEEKDYSKSIEDWWRAFNVDDKQRAKYSIYHLPCNLESPNNINSARMDFTIPAEKPILISVVNAINYAKHNSPTLDKSYMETSVKTQIDNIGEKFLRIGDVDFTHRAERVRSGFFDLDYDNIAITDGYWLMLNGLSPGEYEIERGACTTNGGKEETASTHYNIKVV